MDDSQADIFARQHLGEQKREEPEADRFARAHLTELKAESAADRLRRKVVHVPRSQEANARAIINKGIELLEAVEAARTPPEPVLPADGLMPGMAVGTFDRELNTAIERIEEAVMWAVEHLQKG